MSENQTRSFKEQFTVRGIIIGVIGYKKRVQ